MALCTEDQARLKWKFIDHFCRSFRTMSIDMLTGAPMRGSKCLQPTNERPENVAPQSWLFSSPPPKTRCPTRQLLGSPGVSKKGDTFPRLRRDTTGRPWCSDPFGRTKTRGGWGGSSSAKITFCWCSNHAAVFSIKKKKCDGNNQQDWDWNTNTVSFRLRNSLWVNSRKDDAPQIETYQTSQNSLNLLKQITEL